MARKLGTQLGIPDHIVQAIGWKDGVDQSLLLYMGLNNGYVKVRDFEPAVDLDQADHLPDRQTIDYT